MKTILKNIVILFLFTALSCSKEDINNKITTGSTQLTVETKHFKIGQRYGGGIIFYIDKTGQHGLIGDTVDLSKRIKWDPSNEYAVTKIVGGTNHTIGSGNENTRRIVDSLGHSGNYAARLCREYEGSGYKDWYLPSINELNQMYVNNKAFGGFGLNDYYWSSTERPDPKRQGAMTEVLNEQRGDQTKEPKYDLCFVRAVRSF
jgi:hypothetical protein